MDPEDLKTISPSWRSRSSRVDLGGVMLSFVVEGRPVSGGVCSFFHRRLCADPLGAGDQRARGGLSAVIASNAIPRIAVYRSS